MTSRLLTTTLLLTSLLTCFSPDSLGWGEAGHRLVGEVAMQLLAPDSQRQVKDMLRSDGSPSLGDAGRWADQIRRNRRDTEPLHYINIPLCGRSAHGNYCPEGRCVTGAIAKYQAILADPNADGLARREGFKFLVHFVADLHQPLHTIDNGDQGGNRVRVHYTGLHTHRKDDLHGLWDNLLLQDLQRADRQLSKRLLGEITAADYQVWSQGSPEDWANQSHGLAVTHVYGRLPGGVACNGAPKSVLELDVDYGREAFPVIEMQIKRAAVRLASLLTATLR